ncbi:MAG: hypothetical protein QM775_25795 [Pirellulales bacterium]
MRSFCRSWIILAVALSCAGSGFAADTWWRGTWKGWKREFHHNNVWPEQYLDHDRSAARAPFEMMVANGWRTQNTISSYHFNEQTGDLNETGRLKLRAILFETPPEYQSIFVLRADDPKMTAARVKSVQDHAQALAQGADPAGDADDRRSARLARRLDERRTHAATRRRPGSVSAGSPTRNDRLTSSFARRRVKPPPAGRRWPKAG